MRSITIPGLININLLLLWNIQSKKQNFAYGPTLNTVLLVEDTLKNIDKIVITLAELKKILPKKINHNTLKIIFEYLEDNNKIIAGTKEITWIHNRNLNLRKAIDNGLEL